MLVPAATAAAAAGPALAAGTCPAASSAASAVPAGHPAGAVGDMLLPRGLALWEGGCTAAARPAWPEVSEARLGTCACWSDAAPSAAAASLVAATATLLPGRLPLLLRCGLRLTPAAVAGSAAASSPSHSAAKPQLSPAGAAPPLPQPAAAPTGCISVGGCTRGAPCATCGMLALPSPEGIKLSARSGAGAGASADQPGCAGVSASTCGGAACTRANISHCWAQRHPWVLVSSSWGFQSHVPGPPCAPTSGTATPMREAISSSAACRPATLLAPCSRLSRAARRASAPARA